MPAGASTLADHETLASLAAALDDHGVYAARLFARMRVWRPVCTTAPTFDSDRIDALGVPQCEGIIGYAVGVADDGGPLVVLAFASADANAGTLADVLGDGLKG